MKSSVFYRIASVLFVLFAIAHTFGFQHVDPAWRVDAVVGAMKSVRFDALGSSRTYWDFFLAGGYSGAVFYVFVAILAWQLGGLPAETLARMRLTAWAFALCFAAVSFVSWTYLFIIPVVFAVATTVCLAIAALFSGKVVRSS